MDDCTHRYTYVDCDGTHNAEICLECNETIRVEPCPHAGTWPCDRDAEEPRELCEEHGEIWLDGDPVADLESEIDGYEFV